MGYSLLPRLGSPPRVALLICATLIVVAGCRKAPTETSQNDDCVRPADVILTEQQIELATAQIGKASVGGLKVVNNSELIELLSDADRSALIVNFMLCEAQKRGELDPKDRARVDYVTRMLNYLYVAKPTADAFGQWLRDNPAPTAPQAKLHTPDFPSDGRKRQFAVSSGHPRQSFRLMNTGQQPLMVWLAEYPRERMLFAPHSGPYKLAAGETTELVLGILCCTVPASPMMMRVRSDVPDDIEVEVSIAKPEMLATAFSNLTQAFARELIATQDSGDATNPPVGELDAASRLASVSHAVVLTQFASMDNRLAWAISGSLLEAVNWPHAAVAAYRKGRELSPARDDSFDAPLSRALYYAGLQPNTQRGETSYVTLADSGERGLDQELTVPSQLRIASVNPLTSGEPKLAESALAALEKDTVFQRFAMGLRGDLYLAQNNPEAASKQFDLCFGETRAPTCGLRSVEAGVAARDISATTESLKVFEQNAPDAASRIWARTAIKELQIH